MCKFVQRISQEFNSCLRINIYQTLDTVFRDFSCLDESIFPDDEFDEEEAKSLSLLCRSIANNGYREIELAIKTEEGMRLVDTAAGYGEFVDPSAGIAYLGVFIAAELNMKPFAIPTFEKPLLRSPIFENACSDVQQLVLTLIHIARALRGIDLYAELRTMEFFDKIYFNED